MNKIDISGLSKKNIKKERLVELVPEVNDLKKIIENSPWHNKESVFNHTFSTLNNLKKIVCSSNKNIKRYLNQIIDKNSRKDLLFLAVLLHDIGKKEIAGNLIKVMDHEKKGAKIAKKILKRFNLSPKESTIIINIIKQHGFMSRANVLDNKNFRKEHKNFKDKFLNIYTELILLSFADISGSYLKKTEKARFYHQTDFYKKEIKDLPSVELLNRSNV